MQLYVCLSIDKAVIYFFTKKRGITMEFPEYMDYFGVSYSPEFVEILCSIESSFFQIHYDKHIDLITNIFQYEGTDILRSLCDQAILIYRTHIYDCLQMQGIYLTNHEDDKLSILAQILQGTIVLAKTKVNDITNGELLDEEEDENWFMALLSLTSNLSSDILLLHIERVEPEVIDILKSQETITDYVIASDENSKKRLLRIIGENRDSVVLNAIKDMQTMNYSPDALLQHVMDDLEVIEDPKLLRREIRYLLAGSRMKDIEAMKEWAERTVEQIVHDPKKIFLVNSQWESFEDLKI